eukprot:scaffold8227_cov119-Isochrysis_galbana.AAC.3
MGCAHRTRRRYADVQSSNTRVTKARAATTSSQSSVCRMPIDNERRAQRPNAKLPLPAKALARCSAALRRRDCPKAKTYLIAVLTETPKHRHKKRRRDINWYATLTKWCVLRVPSGSGERGDGLRALVARPPIRLRPPSSRPHPQPLPSGVCNASASSRVASGWKGDLRCIEKLSLRGAQNR